MFIVDSFNIDLRYSNYWQLFIMPMLVDSGFDVELISNKRPIPIMHGMWGEIAHKNSQFDAIFENKFAGKLIKGSEFIFTDAYSTTAIHLKMISDIYDYDFKMYGIWNSGVFNPSSFLRNKYLGKPKTWILNFERAMYHAYDQNWYPSEAAGQYHKKRLQGTKPNQIANVGVPIGYLKNATYDISKKENLIIFPFDSKHSDQSIIMEIFGEIFSEYEFVVCSKQKHTRATYEELLSRAKVMLSLSVHDDNPIILYDAIKHGCIPAVPNIPFYANLLDPEFLYDPMVLKPPKLHFVRHSMLIEEKFKNYLDNYEKYIILLNSNIEKLEETYYTDKFFLEKLHIINDRKHK